MLIDKLEKNLLLISLLLVLYIWECLFPYFGTFLNKTRHAARNLTVVAINFAAANVLLVPLVVFSTHTQWGVFRLVSLSEGAELVLTIVLIDLLTYAMHVLYHTRSFLWRFHRMHHSDPEMDVTSGARFHLGEHILSTCV
jgi:sterol desaturase/sphingolipid hydroxylase (fatty acid hydroxylase superfamily)